MSESFFDFNIEREDSIKVIVQYGSKSINQLQNITEMYEDYCISTGIHARIQVDIFPTYHTHEWIREVFLYYSELKIDNNTKTIEIQKFNRNILLT